MSVGGNTRMEWCGVSGEASERRTGSGNSRRRGVTDVPAVKGWRATIASAFRA